MKIAKAHQFVALAATKCASITVKPKVSATANSNAGKSAIVVTGKKLNK